MGRQVSIKCLQLELSGPCAAVSVNYLRLGVTLRLPRVHGMFPFV